VPSEPEQEDSDREGVVPRSTGMEPARDHAGEDAVQADPSRGPPGRLLPLWWGALGAAAIVALLVAGVPEVRAWALRVVGYPVAALVLGRDAILVEGVRIEAAPEPGVTGAFAVMVVLLLLGLRWALVSRPGDVWSPRVRLDTPFALALVPYIALAPVLFTLAALQLFQVPWAFFAVPPLLVLLVVAFVLFSLVFAFWVQKGGRGKGPLRFLASVVTFLLIGLFWIVAMGGTTTPLPWWIAAGAVLLVVVVQYAVTLGNRIYSHRRALFSLGSFHLAFFGGFLLLWTVQGPWPVQGWSLEGQEALRELTTHSDGFFLVALALGPPVLVTVGFYTIGAFLHSYAAWARVWVDGLSLMVVFAQTLDAWAVALKSTNPYGALDHSVSPPGWFAPWALSIMGPWGYLLVRLVAAVALVLVFSLPRRMATGRWLEFRTIALGVLMGFGLVAGLRYTLALAVGT
jgi:uncharacterized membrane protein